jgi:hypothetical protein
MKTLSRSTFHSALFLLASLLLLAGCGTTKDAVARGDMSTLKASHLAFIDQFTEGTGKTWDDQKLSSATAAMEKQFSDAEQYAATKKDARRTNALSILHKQFTKNAATLARKKAFFRPTFATELKAEVSQNYDLALKGEDLRS